MEENNCILHKETVQQIFPQSYEYNFLSDVSKLNCQNPNLNSTQPQDNLNWCWVWYEYDFTTPHHHHRNSTLALERLQGSVN